MIRRARWTAWASVSFLLALTGGAAYWLAVTATPDVSAQEVVTAACSKTVAAGHFDIHTTSDAPGTYDDFEFKASIAGADYHLVGFSADMSMHGEEIKVDGKTYARMGTRTGEGKWEVYNAPLSDSIITNPLGTGRLSEGGVVCPSLDEDAVVKIGEETLNGIEMTRYRKERSLDYAKAIWPDEKDRLGRTHVVFFTHDFWIDETGQLVQVKLVQSFPPEEGQTGRQMMEQVTKISGVGETNTITAPVVSGQ